MIHFHSDLNSRRVTAEIHNSHHTLERQRSLAGAGLYTMRITLQARRSLALVRKVLRIRRYINESGECGDLAV